MITIISNNMISIILLYYITVNMLNIQLLKTYIRK